MEGNGHVREVASNGGRMVILQVVATLMKGEW